MRPSLPILSAALVAPAALALAAGVVTVTQKGRAFSVHDVQIVRGDSVRFANDDEFVHQIYTQSSSFSYESAEQPPGEAVVVRFPVTGTFEVRCHIHPKMLLHVDVR